MKLKKLFSRGNGENKSGGYPPYFNPTFRLIDTGEKMKINDRIFILVFASLLASESLLKASPKNARENDESSIYAPNSLALEQNTKNETIFWNDDQDALEAQEQAKKTAENNSLKNNITTANERISDLARQLNQAITDIKKIKREHAELRMKKQRE